MSFKEFLNEGLLNKVKNFSAEDIKVGSKLYKDDNDGEEYIIIIKYDKKNDEILYKDNLTKKEWKTNFKTFWKSEWTYNSKEN